MTARFETENEFGKGMELTPELHPVILRVLVGSHAHGLARPDSDYDYREVFAIPTSTMLSLREHQLKFAWMDQNKHTDDVGGDEIAKWLHLCAKGAPNAVELCFAPLDEAWDPAPLTEDFNVFPSEVQQMGRRLLTHDAVKNGVIGYAMNSFRKIPEKPGKWKAGMLRVLYQGEVLLRTGDTSLAVADLPEREAELVRAAAANEVSEGEALDEANRVKAIIESTKRGLGLPVVPDYETVNDWLLNVRREFWRA